MQDFNIQLSVTRLANVHYFEFTSLYHTKDDSHDFCELLFVDKGSITVHSDNFSGTLNMGDMMIHRPGEAHSLSSFEDIAPNVIIIGFECDSAELVPFSLRPVRLQSEHRRILASILAEAMSIYEPPYDVPNTPYMKKKESYRFGADQMIKLLLESFLISVIRDLGNSNVEPQGEDTASNVNIRAVHQYITDNYTAKIHLDNLCFLFGTNKTSLCRSFKREYGCTIFEYINSMKIKEAKALLRSRQMSTSQIADSLGFESVHYFCRVFKKQTGQSPTEYMKTVKSKLEL